MDYLFAFDTINKGGIWLVCRDLWKTLCLDMEEKQWSEISKTLNLISWERFERWCWGFEMWKKMGISKHRGKNMYKSICIFLVYLRLLLLMESIKHCFFFLSCVKFGYPLQWFDQYIKIKINFNISVWFFFSLFVSVTSTQNMISISVLDQWKKSLSMEDFLEKSVTLS